MEKTLKVGIAVKPQGVRGEIKVVPLTDDPSRFKSLKQAIIDGVPHKILNVRIVANEVFVTLSGVSDRTAAEAFRGKFLYVDRADAIVPEEGSYFIADLIGVKVVTESGEELGVISEITEGKTDVIWIVTPNGKKAAFPFLKRVLSSVDTEKGVMLVKDNIGEVICRED